METNRGNHQNEPVSPIRQLTHQFLAKAVAVALFVICAFTAGLSLAATVYTYTDQLNSHSTDPMESALVRYSTDDWNDRAMFAYRNAFDGGSLSDEAFDPSHTNYRYVITDQSGKVLASNAEDPDALVRGSVLHNIFSDGSELIIQGYIALPSSTPDAFTVRAGLAQFLYANKALLIVLAVVGLLLSAALFVFLMCAAGRHADSASPRRCWIDRIPFDLLLVFTCGVLALAALPIMSIRTPDLWALAATVECIALILNLLWFVLMTMTFAVRIKTRTFWKNNVCVIVLLFVWRIVKACWRFVTDFFSHIPLLWKGVVGFIVLGILMLVLSRGGTKSALLLLAIIAALFVGMVRTLLQLDRLKKDAAALAAGDLSAKVDTKGMPRALKDHGEHLNCVALGMSRAVDERMKSERMKTDLITNVSHDLKTPLTSIVNYVDLLKKEPLDNETAAGYVEALDRQATRLKKLTEDIVEASRAASGTITPHLAPADMCELMRQSLAEYGDRFAAVPIEPVLTAPETPVLACCDGRLLWRVFDNLLNNVLKYTQPHTRVYLDVCLAGGKTTATVKNTSREALNISPDELTERFVRGDASRSSDGSGLGLSIAKSLVELMAGTFTVSISGDLFTATVTLPMM